MQVKAISRALILGLCFSLCSCGHDFAFYIHEGDSLKEKTKFNEASQNYQLALKEARKKKSKDELLKATLRLAQLRLIESNQEQAATLFAEAAELAAAVPSAGPACKASCLNEIAKLHLLAGRKDEGLEKLKESLQVLSEAQMEDSAAAAETSSLLGSFYAESGQYKLADKYLRLAVAAYQAHPEDYGSYSRTLSALANNCRQSGKEDEALEFDQKAKTISVSGLSSVTGKAYAKFNQ